jgi:hypothetical protein
MVSESPFIYHTYSQRSGATFLLSTPAPSTSDEVSHTSPTTPLETHPSTWLAEEPHLPTPGSLIVSQLSGQAPTVVKEPAENATLDSTANTQHTSDVTVGRPVDPHHEQDKINADADADSVQSMSRRPQSSGNEGSTFNFEDYIDTSLSVYLPLQSIVLWLNLSQRHHWRAWAGCVAPGTIFTTLSKP